MAAAESSVFQCTRTSKVVLVSRKCDLNSAIAQDGITTSQKPAILFRSLFMKAAVADIKWNSPSFS